MLPSERRRAIAAAVTAGTRTEDLAEHFGVSGETIRRDLIRLERDGLLNRVYGGAEPAERLRSSEAGYGSRRSMNLEAKLDIAAAAASILRPDQVVIIDVGTTAVEVARKIPADWTGSVVTNSLLVAAELSGREGVELTVLGGRLRSGDLAASGPLTLAALGELYADIAFLGSGGLDARAGLTDYYSDEIQVRRLMISHSARTYVLADASKFDVIAACAVCPLDDLDALITDRGPEGLLAQALTAADVRVLLPSAPSAASSLLPVRETRRANPKRQGACRLRDQSLVPASVLGWQSHRSEFPVTRTCRWPPALGQAGSCRSPNRLPNGSSI